MKLTEEKVKETFDKIGINAKSNDAINTIKVSRRLDISSKAGFNFDIIMDLQKSGNTKEISHIQRIDVYRINKEEKNTTRIRLFHSEKICGNIIEDINNEVVKTLERINNELAKLDGLYLAGIKMYSFLEENGINIDLK